MLHTLRCLVLLPAALACTSAPPSDASIEAELMDRYRQLIALGVKGKAEEATAMHTENAVLMPPNGKVMQGHDAVRKMMALPPGTEITETVIDNLIAEGDDRFAYHAGTWAFTVVSEDGEKRLEGRYVMAWKKVDGEWKVAVDMWDSKTVDESK